MSARQNAEPSAPPSLSELFLEFVSIGISGFGGVMPIARKSFVERRRWLTDDEFLDALSLCQFLPGPNIVNMSIVIGNRYHGATGAIVSAIGLLSLPFILVTSLAALFAEVGGNPLVIRVFAGISAAAAGLVLAMGLKLVQPVARSRWQLGVGIATFLAIGALRLPLLPVLATLVPLSIAIAWWQER